MKTKTLLHKTDRKYPDFRRLFFGTTSYNLWFNDETPRIACHAKTRIEYGVVDTQRARIVSESWHMPVTEWEDRALVEKFKNKNC